MKKLFALHPSIILDEFNSLRITGFYQLKALSEQSVSFQTDDYFITIQGEEVTVLALTEQSAHVSIIELKDVTIRYNPNEERLYES
ncbi:YabP/YqfC family sporulation protein [Sporosarcina obsidiansis]|uniref:YabP/YqfC family sporulation protein n=1 Tax=Sporosarcina obsidiansis TaxID=2660748 RepID=UPI001890C992|nr:YabP/YqfC family sporulation protein [Sporosarcina obsidiansis]